MGGMLRGGRMRGERMCRTAATGWVLLAALLAMTGCATQTPAALVAQPPPDFDRPIGAEAKRDTAAYRVDLAVVADCEARFDLRLYRDRNIELVRWDDQDGCNARAIDVQFLPAGIAEPKLFDRVKSLSRSVERRPQK